MRGKPWDKNRIMRHFLDFLCGVLIGAGAILPGVSGGVLAVIFDLYRPFMEVLTRPTQALPKYWTRFAPVAAGGAVGLLGFARGISAAMSASAAATVWLFVGLIMGTVPQLYREAGRKGRSAASWVSCAVCAAAVFTSLYHMSRITDTTEVMLDFWRCSLCGVLWGMGVVIPGMTTSSVMMALGVYEPMMESLARLDLVTLAGALPGMVLTVLLLARTVSWLFRRHYSVAFHGILGIVVASALVIAPAEYRGAWEMALSALLCVLGVVLALSVARLDRKIEK